MGYFTQMYFVWLVWESLRVDSLNKASFSNEFNRLKESRRKKVNRKKVKIEETSPPSVKSGKMWNYMEKVCFLEMVGMIISQKWEAKKKKIVGGSKFYVLFWFIYSNTNIKIILMALEAKRLMISA